MVDDVLAEAEEKMSKSVEVLKRELSTIRTGRAGPGLVEHLRVDYYGTPTAINQLATVTVPEVRLLVIQPWDRKSLASIERAILKSDLGINPVNDGTVLRLPIPPLTEERRRELIRQVHKRAEEGKVALRNVRRDAAEQLRAMERGKEISEDDQHRGMDRLQKLVDSFSTEADHLSQAKEAELLEV